MGCAFCKRRYHYICGYARGCKFVYDSSVSKSVCWGCCQLAENYPHLFVGLFASEAEEADVHVNPLPAIVADVSPIPENVADENPIAENVAGAAVLTGVPDCRKASTEHNCRTSTPSIRPASIITGLMERLRPPSSGSNDDHSLVKPGPGLVQKVSSGSLIQLATRSCDENQMSISAGDDDSEDSDADYSEATINITSLAKEVTIANDVLVKKELEVKEEPQNPFDIDAAARIGNAIKTEFKKEDPDPVKSEYLNVAISGLDTEPVRENAPMITLISDDEDDVELVNVTHYPIEWLDEENVNQDDVDDDQEQYHQD